MNVLVDTSVWVDHFRNDNLALRALLAQDRVMTHPMIIAEICCGTPPAPRKESLNNLRLLQSCSEASLEEVIAFVEQEKLFGLGCGLVDMALLASTLLSSGTKLWTLDKRLTELATRFGVTFILARH